MLVVEGPEDKIAVTETLKKLNKIKIRSEEINITVVVANGVNNIPFFVRVLNAFSINYVVLHDSDLKDGITPEALDVTIKRNKKIIDLATAERTVLFPIKLENTVNQIQHFKDQYFTLLFFSNHENITTELENIINSILVKLNLGEIASNNQITAEDLTGMIGSVN